MQALRVKANETVVSDSFVELTKGSRICIVREGFESHINLRELDSANSSSANGSAPEFGRGTVSVTAAEPKVVLRKYKRGGVARFLVKDVYLGVPFLGNDSLRPMRELKILSFLFKQGVAVPEPVCAYVRFLPLGFLYKSVLGTRLVPNAINLRALIELGEVDSAGACELAKQAGAEAGKMLSLGVFHPDLHLANVICDAERRPYLIDFDKAKRISTTGALDKYYRMTLERWGRYLRKYGLSDELNEAFANGVSAKVDLK